MARISPQKAREILKRAEIDAKERPDFFTLSSSQVGVLLDAANECGYRKPAQAAGSRGRYWYAYLCRLLRVQM